MIRRYILNQEEHHRQGTIDESMERMVYTGEENEKPGLLADQIPGG